MEKSQVGFQISCSALISLIAAPPPKKKSPKTKQKNLDENKEWFCSLLNSGKNCSKVAMEQDQYQTETEGGKGGSTVSSFLITMFLLVVPFPGTQRGGLCALRLIGSTKAGSFNAVH